MRLFAGQPPDRGGDAHQPRGLGLGGHGAKDPLRQLRGVGGRLGPGHPILGSHWSTADNTDS